MENFSSRRAPSELSSTILLKFLAQNYDVSSRQSQEEVITYLKQFYSRIQLRKMGFKFSNELFTSVDSARKRRRTVDLSKELQSKRKRKHEDSILSFLENNSEIGANNSTVNGPSVDNIVPNRLISDTRAQLYRDYCVENPTHTVSASTFSRCIPKNYKKASGKSDLCEICVKGKENVRKLAELEANLGTVSGRERTRTRKEIKNLKEDVKSYKDHVAHKNIQREAFNTAKSDVPVNTVMMVMDFKENIIIGKGPNQTNQQFYQREPRTVFGIVLYYRMDNTIQKHHVNVVSKVLNHDSKFVGEALSLVLEKKNSFFRQFNKLVVWSDGGPHFCSNETVYHLFKSVPTKMPNFKEVEWNRFAHFLSEICSRHPKKATQI